MAYNYFKNITFSNLNKTLIVGLNYIHDENLIDKQYNVYENKKDKMLLYPL